MDDIQQCYFQAIYGNALKNEHPRWCPPEDFEFRSLIVEGRSAWRNHADLLWGQPKGGGMPPDWEDD